MSVNASNGGIPADQSDSIRLIHYNRQSADLAFTVHVTLLGVEELRPELKHNPFWTIARQDAFERFSLAFEEVGK